METFSEQIKEATNLEVVDEETRKDFLQLLETGAYIKGEGAEEHFSVYFLPFNPQSKQVFVVHHKKATLWLSPGGHIEPGEIPLDTFKREVHEELGVEIDVDETTKPFFLSTVEITEKPDQRGCRKHYDIWFLVETDGSDFVVDTREFFEAKWVSIDDARELITDPSNLRALDIIEQEFSN